MGAGCPLAEQVKVTVCPSMMAVGFTVASTSLGASAAKEGKIQTSREKRVVCKNIKVKLFS